MESHCGIETGSYKLGRHVKQKFSVKLCCHYVFAPAFSLRFEAWQLIDHHKTLFGGFSISLLNDMHINRKRERHNSKSSEVKTMEGDVDSLRRTLRTQSDARFVGRDDFLKMLVSSGRFLRADEVHCRVRGLLDLSSQTRYLIEEEKLLERSRYGR